MNLNDFLYKKPLYYKEIDHERIHIAYGLLKPHIRQPKTVHVVGTNGKGSTGRVIAHLAYKSGLNVGHYTSPHILKLNERIWLNGTESSDKILEQSHQRLLYLLGEEMSDILSYFEYMTLLAFVVLETCDLMVLEAGLGGEYDATNVCNKELSVITPIGIDHQAFLGETIEEIAGTKIRSIQKQAVVAPQPYPEVLKVAKQIADQKGATLFTVESIQSIDKNHELNVRLYHPLLVSIAKNKAWADYLVINASVALKALDILGITYDINTLKSLELFGRFYALTPNIRIDVGHNPLAARAIVQALDKKVVLIYNALEDKNHEEVLRILKPKIKRVEIIKIHSQRAITTMEIEKVLVSIGLEYSSFENKMDEDENYLVFGSFYVVEAFLKQRKECNVSK